MTAIGDYVQTVINLPITSIFSASMAYEFVIDKIVISLNPHLPLNIIIEVIVNAKKEFMNFTEDGYGGIETKGFKFFVNTFNQQIYKIICNPNEFQNYYIFIKERNLLLTKDQLNKSKLSQVDYCLNIFNIRHDLLVKSLLVKRKRIYEEKGIHNTQPTHYFGKKPKKTKLYDKNKLLKKLEKKILKKWQQEKREKLSAKSLNYSHWSEVEIEVYREKLPTRNVLRILKSSISDNWNPFKEHFLIIFKLKQENQIPPKSKKFYYQFLALAEINGFHAAYKILNKQRNFKRSLKNIIESKEEIDLAKIYTHYAQKYFNEAKDLYLLDKGGMVDEN